MKKSVFAIVLIFVISPLMTLSAQEPLPAVYVDMTEVGGLAPDGRIPSWSTDLTIPVRFHNVDVPRTMISNGFIFGGTATFDALTAEWNPYLPWDYPHVPFPEMWPPYFDDGIFTVYFDAELKGSSITDAVGVGFAGLTGLTGTGLPADFHSVAYTITLEGVTGPTGAVLTMDSTWWLPANFWLWSGVGPNVSWGGPYEWVVGAEGLPPIITSEPVTVATELVPYAYDVDAYGFPDPTFALLAFPAGMGINQATGLITWTPAVGQAGTHTVTVAAINGIAPSATQVFDIVVQPIEEPFTTCWPNPIQLKALENNRVLNVSIWNDNFEYIDRSTIRVFNIPPYTEVRMEGDSMVTDAAVMRFLGVGGFRPIPSLGYDDAEYTVSYTLLDGMERELVGRFNLSVTSGDVTFDGVADIDDVIFMTEYFFSGGPKARLWNEPMDEFMDIDGNGRIDLLDVRELMAIVM